MDIKILQQAIIDGLEDVKGHDIKVFDTTHLTSLFDRVVIASGTSNRQTRSLASSVADKVREAGGRVVSTEGADTGEWVLVDLGDAIVHILQPAIRQYYNLEELWGGKAVKVKLASQTRSIAGGVREDSADEDDEDAEPVINKARFAKPKLAPARDASSTTTIDEALPVRKPAAKKAAAKKVAAKKVARKTAAPASEGAPAKKAAPRKVAAKKIASDDAA